MDSLQEMLEQQWAIQSYAFGHDLDIMTPSARMEYIRTMILAAQNELHEALNETGWKPWSTGDHVHTDLYIGELVDAWIMLMNLFLATGMYPDEVADQIVDRTQLKQKLNIQRQESGY